MMLVVMECKIQWKAEKRQVMSVAADWWWKAEKNQNQNQEDRSNKPPEVKQEKEDQQEAKGNHPQID